jgi:hypothetical protein
MNEMESQGASSTTLVRKRTDSELMPPPPPPKRIKRPRKVLDEDTYTGALSQIIARDFFPGLLESETQQEYLDALDSKDQAWISSASQRLQQVMTPGRPRPSRVSSLQPGGRTPVGYAGDTPASNFPTATEDKAEVNINMSLGGFQSKYTSEDNESFYKLLDKQNQKQAEKYAWLWGGNKLPSKMHLKQKEIETKLCQTRSLTDDGFSKDRLAIRDKDERPAAPDSWKSMPNNGLMFNPEGVDGAMETIAERAQAQSRAAPRSIAYENTRMPGPSVIQEQSVPPSPSLSAVRDAISGKPRAVDLDSSTGSGGETPRVNGYAFVDDEEPEPEPEAQPSPAPLLGFGPGDASPNPFQLQEQRKREALHHRMVERISQSKRASAKLGLTGRVEKTPVPKFPNSPRATGGLTPAAQRLLGKIDVAGKSTARSPFSQVKATPLRGKGSGLRHAATSAR